MGNDDSEVTMTQGPASGGPSASVVLGISVVDDQIASVVRDADGNILASNLVDLPDPSAQGAEAAIVELVESVPVVVDRIGVSVSREDVRRHLAQAFAPSSPGTPEWADRVTVTDYSAALTEMACTHATRGGVVAVVDLDRDAAPAAGTTLATVDTASGAVLGTTRFEPGQVYPVPDPDGASRLAAAIGKLPRGGEISSIVVAGPGAEVPGIAPAIEYASQRPVTVVDNPSLASALGAADAAAALETPGPTQRVSTGRRWWFVGAAIGAAVFLGAVGLTLIVAAERDTPEPAPVTVTRTPSAVTVTADAKTVTETRTEVETRERTTTVTSTPRPVTRTTTVTESEEPVATVTETTTTTVTVPVPGQAPAYGPGTPGTPGTSGTP